MSDRYNLYNDVFFSTDETKTWWLRVKPMVDLIDTFDDNCLVRFARGFIYMELLWLHKENGMNNNRKKLIETLSSINFDKWNTMNSLDRSKIELFVKNTNWKCIDPSEVIQNNAEHLKNMIR